MAFTRAEVEGMSEADLRRHVLIPMFEAMGFRQVRESHGSGELGKDIVMWNLDRLGLREDYAVVAKVGRLSGKTSGCGSAGEVTFQAQQALNTTFPDSITGEPRKPRQCYIVTSGAVSEPARTAITAGLGERRHAVRLIDGDELWRLVKEHVSGAAFQQAVQDIRRATDDASRNWIVVPTIEQGMTTLSLRPKHPRAPEVEPPTVHGTFTFPDTPEGREALSAYRRHVATGAPVKLGPPVTIDLRLPEFLRSLLGIETPGVQEVHLRPRQRQEPVHLRLSMHSTSGIEVAHDRVTFRVVQGGTDEITFESVGDGNPWRFVLVINRRGPLHLTYKAHYGGANVRVAAHGAKFEHAMLEGGELRIYEADSGLLYGATATPPSASADELTSHEVWIRLLDALALIQATSGIPLKVPEGDILQEEAERAFALGRVLSQGVWPVHHPGKASTKMTSFSPEGARQMLDAEGGPGSQLVFRGEEEETATLFGATIPLGRKVVLATQYLPSEATRQRLQSFLAGVQAGEDMELEFEPAEGATAEIVYVKWAPEDVLRRLPPEVLEQIERQ